MMEGEKKIWKKKRLDGKKRRRKDRSSEGERRRGIKGGEKE